MRAAEAVPGATAMSVGTWAAAMSDARYECFEDPLTGAGTAKAEFHSIYGDACEELFSSQSGVVVEDFFSMNPVVHGLWAFVDDNARADMYDLAVELHLVHGRAEVCAGETDAQRRERGN